MARYTDTQRSHAVDLAADVGPTKASRQLDIPRRTISDWMKKAGVDPPQANTEKTTNARATAAEKVAMAWGDHRANEAIRAGAAAARLRGQIGEASDEKDHQLLRARAVAYGILIDKAELLSADSTGRIEEWSESEVDKQLREAMTKFEEALRQTDG